MAEITGTSSGELLTGTADADHIDALGGNDTVRGGDGDDQLWGGSGRDHVFGDAGNDSLIIRAPEELAAGEIYDGGAGFDTLFIGYDYPGFPAVPVFDLTGTSLLRLEAIESIFETTITSAQLASFTSIGGTFRIANGGTVLLDGKQLRGFFQLANVATTFDLSTSTGDFVRIFAGAADTTVLGTSDIDLIAGASGNDILRGNGGDDNLNGGAGFDQLFGGDGDDQLIVTGGADIVAGEKLDGGAGFDFVSVETVAGDVDFGLLSVSNVEGLSSLGSINRLLITSAQLAQFERVGVAARIVDTGAVTLHNADFSGSFLFLGDAVTSLDASGIGAATDGLGIFGNGGTNILTGSNGSEGLSGGDGSDSIYGGGGRDGLRGDGDDDRLEGGMGDDSLDGGAGIDLLYGQEGNDILTPGTVSAVAGEIYDGGSGIDLLSLNGVGSVAGGIDISAATIVGIEAIDGGEFSFSSLNTAQFMAASQLTGRLALTDGGSVSLVGKTTLSLAGDIYGGALVVTLSSFGNSIDLAGSTPAIGINVFGGIGNDVILGGSIGSQILAGGGNDRIASRATSGLDNMLGGDGDDIIDARLGRGGLNGEAGNDVLMVAENSGGSAISGGTGIDRLVVEGNFFTGPVFSGIEALQLEGGATLSLTADQFRSGLSSTAAISGVGTIAVRSGNQFQTISAASLVLASGTQLTIRMAGEAQNDQLTGHASASNFLDGDSGSDRLVGGNRNDTLNGGFGSDLLFGGGGADMMDGGEGNDRIVVDNLGDVAIGGAGVDTLQIAVANVSYTIAADFEIVSNVSGGAVSITLNALSNNYGGSVGIDVVLAGAGQDTANGRAGNDQLFGEGGNDYLYGEAGIDTLDGGDGNDFLYAGTDSDVLQGGAGADTIYGQDGDDAITGGAGLDQMFGGAGGDRFIFTAASETGATNATADRIRDWAAGDRIDLSAIDAMADGADDAFSFIGAAAFSNVAGELRFQQISGATYMQGDIDGNGVADFIIRVDGVHVLTVADFML